MVRVLRGTSLRSLTIIAIKRPLVKRLHRAKKLATVWVTSMSVTASLEALKRVSCIWYPVQFQRDENFRALLNSGSKINIMTLSSAIRLGLRPILTNVGTQKIDDSALETHGITSASFSLQNSQENVQFFEKTFLLADTSINVVLEMLFLALKNTNVEFTELEKLTWRSYITVKALSTTSLVKLIDKREFGKMTLDENPLTFVVYVAVLKVEASIYLSQTAQIATLQ